MLYNIYIQLERIKEELKVSIVVYLFFNVISYIISYNTNYLQDSPAFINAINIGIAKLRKYYPKNQWISSNNRNKALYISLVLDPRIKEEGLYNLDLTSGQISDIIELLKEEYTR